MSSRIEEAKVLVEGLFGDSRVEIKLEGDTEFRKVFSFYPDEISFSSGEFLGLTEEEAKALKYEKDLAFLEC